MGHGDSRLTPACPEKTGQVDLGGRSDAHSLQASLFTNTVFDYSQPFRSSFLVYFSPFICMFLLTWLF